MHNRTAGKGGPWRERVGYEKLTIARRRRPKLVGRNYLRSPRVSAFRRLAQQFPVLMNAAPAKAVSAVPIRTLVGGPPLRSH